MTHSFYPLIAKMFDLNTAVVFFHISFWVKINTKNKKHNHNQRYWMYSSVRNIAQTLYYLSPHQISTSINKLVIADILLEDNFNKLKYDRTKWYALSDYGLSLLWECESSNSIISDEEAKELEEPNKTIYCNNQLTTQNIIEGVHTIANELWTKYRSDKPTQFDYDKIFEYVHKRVESTAGSALAVIDETKVELLYYAFHIAARHNQVYWAYIDGIYREWGPDIITVAQAEDHEYAHTQSKRKNKS